MDILNNILIQKYNVVLGINSYFYNKKKHNILFFFKSSPGLIFFCSWVIFVVFSDFFLL